MRFSDKKVRLIVSVTLSILALGCSTETTTPVEESPDTAAQEPVIEPGPSFTVELKGPESQPGAEITMCAVVEVGNTELARISAMQTKLGKGSHHLIVYKTDADLTPEPVECEPFSDTITTAPLMLSEIGEERLQLPVGVVMELEPGTRVQLEAHYLNYFDVPVNVDATVTFETVMTADAIADVALFGTSRFEVAPGKSFTSQWEWIDLPNDTSIYALTGHTHRWGTNVEIELADDRHTEGERVYPAEIPFKWDEAPVVQFNPPMSVPRGKGLRFRCSWTNEGTEPVEFGLSAKDEMCFLWAYYYPSKGYKLCARGIFPTCPDDNGPNGGSSISLTADAMVKVRHADGSGSIEGATVTLGDQSDTTNAIGDALLAVTKLETYAIRAQADGLLPTNLAGVGAEDDFNLSASLMTSEMLAEQAGDTAVDATKGTLVVEVWTDGKKGSQDAKVMVDAKHELARTMTPEGELVTFVGDDAPSPGEAGVVMYFNVEPGNTTPAIAEPDGYRCEVWPGGFEDDFEVPIRAGEISRMSFDCRSK